VRVIGENGQTRAFGERAARFDAFAATRFQIKCGAGERDD
jgi:hypothetical protein